MKMRKQHIHIDKGIVLIVLLLIAGVAIITYPTSANLWNQHMAKLTIGDYKDQVKEIKKEQPEELKNELARAKEYNVGIAKEGIPESFAIREGTSDPEYESLLNVTGDGCMGICEIPCIHVKLPVYHYTKKSVLEKGVGHLFGSSLPVGGKNTHAILSAHSGLPSARLFTDLDKLEKGDKFFITVLDTTYAYQVYKIDVVEPDDTSTLKIDPDKDLCTLVTCTPYAVNTHRLLVHGKRVPYNPAEKNAVGGHRMNLGNILLRSLCAAGGIALAYILLKFKDRIFNKKR